MKFKSKQLFTALLFLFVVQFSQGQIVMSAQEAATQGIDVNRLDSLYTPAVGADSIAAAFKGRETAYVEAYYDLIHDLSTYLNQNNFRWGEQIRCYNRIYFAEDGTVDYYIYDFKAYLSDEQKQEFQQLISEFMVNYKFPLESDRQFAQCSPVNFRDTL